MPKRALLPLLQSMQQDIRLNYAVGDRYRPIRQIAQHFNVSQQTAQKAVHKLVDNKMLVARAKSGIRVAAIESNWQSVKPRVVLLSNRTDPRLNRAFLLGINEPLARVDFTASLVFCTHLDTLGLSFGEYLVDLKADAVAALYFPQSALPFFYAETKHLPVISATPVPSLPTLPCIHTNNTRHAHEAAVLAQQRKYRQVLLVSYFEDGPNHVRAREFRHQLARLQPGTSVTYTCLARPDSIVRLHQFFSSFDRDSVVFALDHAANYVVAPYFVSHQIDPTRGFLLFNSEDDEFSFPGLPPLAGVAPSLRSIGRKLGERLLTRLCSGEWPSPLVEAV